MITRAQAQSLAETSLELHENDFVIIESSTLERNFGWVFFYQSRSYVETGDPIEQLAGNSPLVVNRFTGKVIPTGTAHPVEYYIAQYEASVVSNGA